MTPERMRRRCWAVVVVGGVLVLGACGEGSSAAPTTPATTSPAPTVEPTPDATVEPTPVATDRAGEPLVPPERPAAMDNDDEAGAQAAAEYFMELYGYATRSQDLVELVGLCDSASKFCSAVINEVAADTAAGNVTVGSSTTLRTTSVDVPGEHSFYTVWGTLERTPFVTFDAAGSVIYESTGDAALDVAIAIERRPDGSWIVRGAESGVVPTS